MAWSEVSPGKFQRRIGENEAFIKLVGDSGHALDREHWAINATATIHANEEWEEDVAGALNRAWKTLRFQQPSIAAITVDENTLEYNVPDVSTLKQWSQETFHVIRGKNADEFILGIAPNGLATLTHFPDSGEVLLHTAHWRSDGIGILHLIDVLLELTSRSPADVQEPDTLAWGEEVSRLTLPVEVVANMPTEPTPAVKKIAQEYTETFYPAADATGIPFKCDLTTLPGGTRFIRASLSKDETTLVVTGCKKLGLSVTAAVHASIATANYFLASADAKKKHYTSTVRFALRPYLSEPYSTRASGSCILTTGWMKTVPASNHWIEYAKAYDEVYRKGLSKEFIEAHRQYALNLGDLIRNMPQGGPPPSDVDISSLGIAEHYVQRSYGGLSRGLEVRSLSVGVESLTRQGVVFLWTFRDQLNFNLVYNEAFHDQKQMTSFLHFLEERLFLGLSAHS